MEELELDLETLGGEARCEDERARSLRSSRRQWRWRFRRRSREREREGESGRVLASAGCRGVHDGVDDLTSGASAGVRSPNGSQVLRWSATTVSTASIHTLRYLSDRATSTMINSQTVAN